MLAKFGRPSHATVVAYAALFIALGGSSYAAVTLSKDSVTSTSIKNGQVKTADIASNAVTSPKVKDFSLLSKDFKPGQLVAGAPGATGAPGPKGDKGDPGTNGTNGTNGANGATTVVTRVATSMSLPPGADRVATAFCATGERATGGGGRTSNTALFTITASYPTTASAIPVPDGSQGATAWTVLGQNNAGSPQTITAYVLCAAP